MARARSTVEKPVRLTISVTPQVHLAFERLAAASGVSLSRCMGEWLGDTLDAVEHTAAMVERARAAPKLAMREMHAYAMGLADETGEVLARMGPGGLSTVAQAWKGDAVPGGGMPQAHAERRGSAKPPCSPTGVKSPAKKKKQGPSHE